MKHQEIISGFGVEWAAVLLALVSVGCGDAESRMPSETGEDNEVNFETAATVTVDAGQFELTAGSRRCERFPQWCSPDPIEEPPPETPSAEHVLMERSAAGRPYLAYVPGDYASRAEPMQVLLALHPAMNTASSFDLQSRIQDEPAADDVIVIYPEGTQGAMGQSWDGASVGFGGGFGADRGDADYLLAVFDDIAALADVKPRFAVTGFSAGALMTYKMVCYYGDRINAAVPYGAYFSDELIQSASDCPWGATVPLMHMHGTADTSVNPDGTGDAQSIYGFGTLEGYMDVVGSRNAGWVRSADFSGVESALGEPVIGVNRATAYVLIEGITHRWPTAGFGDSTPDGSEAVLEFVLQY